MLILNLKTYPESTSTNLTDVLNSVDGFAKENQNTSHKIYIAPSVPEVIFAKSQYPDLNIISQHVDAKKSGSTTGWTTPEILTGAGINFSLYNHSEHRVWSDNIVEEIKEIQGRGIKLIVCCENEMEAAKILEAEPFGIAFEPKDLIGSGISVTTRPEAVLGFIKLTKGKTKVFIGAGVTTGEDVRSSIELGAEGVLLASAFVKAIDKKAKLSELITPFGQ